MEGSITINRQVLRHRSVTWPELVNFIQKLYKWCPIDLRNSAQSAGRFGGHFRTNKTKPHRGCIPPVPARVTDGIFRQLHGASFGVI